MNLGRISCLFGHHTPDRHKVRHNGYTFVGRCKYCGTPIERDGPKKWSVKESRPDKPGE